MPIRRPRVLRAKTPAYIRARALELLDYDKVSGIFTWRQDRRPRVRAGDEAGTIHPNGYILVTFDGTTYMAHRLAWLVVHGDWPSDGFDVYFIDGDRSNTAWDNIDYRRRVYSTDPKARASLKAWRQRQRDLKSLTHKPTPDDGLEQAPVPADGLVRTKAGQWTVHLPGTPPNAIAYRAPTQAEAAAWRQSRLEAIAFVRAHPPEPLDPTDHGSLSGTHFNAMSLAEARTWVCYDPDTGAFYLRCRPSRATTTARAEIVSALTEGQRADALSPRGPAHGRLVQLLGRAYPAHMLAVFLMTGAWPARRAVRHRDGNRENNAWTNLTGYEGEQAE